MRMHHRLIMVGATVVATAFPMFPTSAFASCAMPVPLDEAIGGAHAVFVGTVTGLDNGARMAEFAVEEVWKGDVAATVVVNGGPSLAEMAAARSQGLDVGTSVDRTYEAGERYLVVAHGAEEGTLRDSGCSHTQPFTAALEASRPATAHAPTALAPDGVGPTLGIDRGWGAGVWIGLIGAGLVTAALGGLALAAWRRRRFPAP